MKTCAIDIADIAHDDMREAARDILHVSRDIDTALRWLDGIDSIIDTLRTYPKRYEVVSNPHLAAIGYRRAVYKHHLIFYTVSEVNGVVSIERVLLARQRWERML